MRKRLGNGTEAIGNSVREAVATADVLSNSIKASTNGMYRLTRNKILGIRQGEGQTRVTCTNARRENIGCSQVHPATMNWRVPRPIIAKSSPRPVCSTINQLRSEYLGWAGEVGEEANVPERPRSPLWHATSTVSVRQECLCESVTYV